MTFFQVLFSKRAEIDFDNLSVDEQYAMARELRLLEANPFPFKKKIKKIKGTPASLYRLRTDLHTRSFRVFFSIVKPNRVIILRIVPKKDADKVLSKIT